MDRIVARWERGVAVALLGVTVIIVVLQVFFRYVLNSSLSWSEEAARYLFIWAALLGFSSSVEARRLFSFEMLAARLPAFGRRVCAGLYVIAALVFLWAIVVNGGLLAARTMSQTSPAMGLPMAAAYAAFANGGRRIHPNAIAGSIAFKPASKTTSSSAACARTSRCRMAAVSRCGSSATSSRRAPR